MTLLYIYIYVCVCVCVCVCLCVFVDPLFILLRPIRILIFLYKTLKN